MNDEKSKAYEDAQAEVLRILNTADSLEKLSADYVRISNSLKVEADSDSDYKYYYLLELEKTLKNILVNKYLKTLGYYENTSDTYKRWEREPN